MNRFCPNHLITLPNADYLGIEYCVLCGEKLLDVQKDKCTKCGSDILGEFCGSCGTKRRAGR